MSFALAAKALLIWFAIMVLAMVNGLLRESVLVPIFGAVPGMALSGVLLSGLILVVTYLFLPWFGTRDRGRFILIGLIWLLLTLVFEFSFGVLRGQTPAEMLHAYTFAGGNIWPIVLLMTAIAPWLAARFRGWV